MADSSGMDMRAAKGTYSGFIGWVKWSTIIIAAFTALIVGIIS